jgi:flagellar protein FliS
MTLTSIYSQQRGQLQRDAILSATPVQLLTMLYDRLMLDLGRAEAAQLAGNWTVASENLIHAQAILSELTASLKTEAWGGADNLLGIYNYVSSALVTANVQRDVELTREGIRLLEPLRQSWHEAAALLPATQQPSRARSTGGNLGIA